MRKAALVFISVISISANLWSQVGYIKYQLNNNKPGVIYNCDLKINSQGSSFTCTMDTTSFEEMKVVDGRYIRISKQIGKYTNFDVFINYTSHELVNIQILKSQGERELYSVTESIPMFNWQMIDSVKEINDHICQMAKTSFRGRDYITWFTPDIPLSVGPWKFNGLPGLIIEILDTQNLFCFTAKEIQIPAKDVIPEQLPENSTIMPLQEFVEYEKAYMKQKKEDRYRKLMTLTGRGGKITKYEMKRYGLETEYEFETKEHE